MNTFMWESPFTAQHLATCERLGVQIIPPVVKQLACGDMGTGGMASPQAIVDACKERLVAAGFVGL
jgi:phosphopantothenoylcysteine synthetase/decarboxylase